MADPVSRELFVRAQRVIPGGVNSPVRAFRAVGGEPVFFRSAKGAYLTGADGAQYIDCVGSWGPAILGHAHPDVVAAIQDAVTRGLTFGAPTELEVLFAEQVLSFYPSMAMMRAVSSGTEATMSALRVARGFTGRDVIVKFEGCYHGHADALLVKAGSGLATFGVPDSAGVSSQIAASTTTLPYNDIPALRALFDARGKEIAAVIVEPVVGNMGCVPPDPGFLEAILELCRANGAVSIFDEVMTGCRVARGGAQERFGLRPDLTCLGKIIGGGMPLAAYGGRADIMQKVAPLGPVYQAGTLSGNPISVTAGLTTLGKLGPEVYDRLENLGGELETLLVEGAEDAGVTPVTVQRVGSMLTLFFAPGPVRSWADADKADRTRFGKWHAGLLARGVYWPPSQFEAAFLSAAHTHEDVVAIANASREAMKELGLAAERVPRMSVVTRASPRLLALGWRATFEDALALLGPGLVPARVALAQRGHYHLLGEEGGFPGEIAGRFRHQQGGAMAWPAVGDWVAAAPNEGGPAVVEHVLPRHTALVRGKSSRKNESAAEPQLLVANVDVVAIVTSMNDDFRERRLERYLAVVRASGASALLVLTKRDLTTEADDYEARARAVAGSAPVVSVSATQADGVEAVRAHLVAGRTLAFVGSSGVGKSTLVNALAGQELRATGAIRESDGRGRHVTTHRELLLLPEGGVLVDTPGLRELALWAGDEEETEDAGFEDIDALAAGCRFRDCGHTQEPGCAVKLAVTTGALSAERLESHHKLEKELAKRREERGARAALAEKRAGKAAVKSVRAMGKRK